MTHSSSFKASSIASLHLYLIITSLSPLLSLRSNLLLPPSYRTTVITFRAHLANVGYSLHLKILNHMDQIPVTIWSNVRRFWGIGHGHLGELLSSLLHTPKNSTYLCKPMISKIVIKVSIEGSFRQGWILSSCAEVHLLHVQNIAKHLCKVKFQRRTRDVDSIKSESYCFLSTLKIYTQRCFHFGCLHHKT